MSLKILLIYPYFFEDTLEDNLDRSALPIGVYYIGALLKENQYNVEILNWYNINKTPEEIEETFQNKKPDVIGFSILNANRWGGIEISQIAKRILPEVKIVFGGVGTTFLWEHLLKNFKEIDYAVLGEGEYSFLNLIQCIENGNYEEISSIKGIALRNGNNVIKTENREMIQDLDSLPMPSKYFDFLNIISSRGCPSNCTFCASPKLWGRRVRFHSPEYFVSQLEMLYHKGITFFSISDDTFTMQKDRVIQICKKILEKNLQITWVAISRVNYVDEEMFYWMKKAGCFQISYGVESGSEKIRNEVMNKNIKTDDIKRAFALTTGYGMVARAYIIIGSPGESWETIQETIDLIHQIKPLVVLFHVFTIAPGTAIYEDFKRRTESDDDVWLEKIENIFYFTTDPLMSYDMILSFQQKLQTDFYFNLPQFVDAIQLVDQKDLHEGHAVFLFTVASYFIYGHYSPIKDIRDKEAIVQRLCKRALSYHPVQGAYLTLGKLKQKEGKYEESMHIISDGLKQFPESKTLTMDLGINHIFLGHYQEAMEQFLAVLELDPHYVDAHLNLANVYMYRGLFDKAIEHYQSVISLKNNCFDAHLNLGVAYFRKGLLDQAKEHYKIGIQLNPNNADAHFNIGLIYLKKGEKENALKEFQEALRLNPTIKEAKDLIDLHKSKC